MPKQQDNQEHANQQPEGIEMGDQGASYGSSYNETTPGQTEANRRESLEDQDENEQLEADADDQSSR
ncbi:MAG: hypothetical protein JOZ51_06685 [Chloroflexi bacterium]|nr:hypothetical protein [Chloroflexota bacterium]